MSRLAFAALVSLVSLGCGGSESPPTPAATDAVPSVPVSQPAAAAQPASLTIGAPFDAVNPPLTLQLVCSNGQACTVRRQPGPLDAPGRVSYTGSLPEVPIPGGTRRATAWGVSADQGQMTIEIVSIWSGGGNPTIPGPGGFNRAAMTNQIPFGSVSQAPLYHMLPDRAWEGHTIDVSP